MGCIVSGDNLDLKRKEETPNKQVSKRTEAKMKKNDSYPYKRRRHGYCIALKKYVKKAEGLNDSTKFNDLKIHRNKREKNKSTISHYTHDKEMQVGHLALLNDVSHPRRFPLG